MELWFTERHTPNVKFSIKVDRQLYSGNSEFQRIDVFASKEFGRFLTLDGYMMLTEKDEFIYHEMITHVPMAVHPDPKDILVIGAGDGGVIRELTRYNSVRSIDLVEIDELVVEVSKKFLPTTACRLDDERVHIHYEDGVKFIRSCENKYDVIIVDSTDPFGPVSWSTSTRAPFMTKTPPLCSAPTRGSWRASPSAEFIRLISLHIPRVTGFSALPRKNITR